MMNEDEIPMRGVAMTKGRDGAESTRPSAVWGRSAQRQRRNWQELSGFTALGGPYTAARRVEETVGEYTHPTRVRQHGCSGADSL